MGLSLKWQMHPSLAGSLVMLTMTCLSFAEGLLPSPFPHSCRAETTGYEELIGVVSVDTPDGGCGELHKFRC